MQNPIHEPLADVSAAGTAELQTHPQPLCGTTGWDPVQGSLQDKAGASHDAMTVPCNDSSAYWLRIPLMAVPLP